MTVDLFIFDCDGVLVDSEPVDDAAVRAALRGRLDAYSGCVETESALERSIGQAEPSQMAMSDEVITIHFRD